MLEQANPLCRDIPRIRPEPCGAPPENVVQRIGMLGRPGGLDSNQLDAERVGKAARNLVLQGEQIGRVAVESLRSKIRVGRGIDQLCADADLAA